MYKNPAVIRCILALLTLTYLTSEPSGAAMFHANGLEVAIKGYDPVAYHTQHKAVKGYSDISYEWKHLKWYFSSSKNRELFEKDPVSYTPAYCGYCCVAMSRGYKIWGNPEIWTIRDKKVYLFANEHSREKWQEDTEKNIERADKNWSL